MSNARANYEHSLAEGVQRRVGAFRNVSAVEVLVEGEFPRTLLLVKVRDARFAGRVLGNYSSVWNEDGTPMFSWDPEARSQFATEMLQEQLEGLDLENLPRPDENGITWF